MTESDLKGLLMNFIRDDKAVISSILEDFEKCKKNSEALQVYRDRIKDGLEVPEERLNSALLTSLKHVNELNTRLLLMLLVYTSAGDFKVDSAKMMNRLGHGEEALREMFKMKMEGRM